jgi:shikimate dehydrogenase
MFPDVGSCPLATGFHAGQIVYDLVYRPRPTRFLQYAAAAGARTIDGLEMLARQAAAALNIWTGCRVSWQKFQAIAERELRKY